MMLCCLICIDVAMVRPVFIINTLDIRRYCETSDHKPNYKACHALVGVFYTENGEILNGYHIPKLL